MICDNLRSTTDVIAGCDYFDTPASFFSNFAAAWDGVRSQVLKLETRQEYVEDGNESLAAFLDGEREKSIELMKEALSNDDEIYELVRSRSIDFTRCHPLSFPTTPYVQWELETYRLTSEKGERIFCCNVEQIRECFDALCQHDFMVFDCRTAFIHDYDDEGKIQGGWMTQDGSKIIDLLAIFGFVKSHCRPFDLFLDRG